MEKEFCLEDYLSERLGKHEELVVNEDEEFRRVCQIVENEFEREWKNAEESVKERKLEREKRAMMGFDKETLYYKERIKEIIQNFNLSACRYPKWYPSLIEGVFAELYGLSGIAPWAYDMTEIYRKSTSAKLIGDRLYCLIDGKVRLQPQRIPARRREQLKRTMLLATPHERLEFGFHEVFLQNGIRITIYSGNRTKSGQEVFVLRKYVMEHLSLEELARKDTISADSLGCMKSMIKAGFNVLFSGQVRSGKTTFLQIWQGLEDRSLEGLAIATDSETLWHEIMPDAPIMQLVADGKELKNLTKSLLRGDNDYVLLEEMRDADAFSLALDITSTGTRRCKGTIHETNAVNVPYKMASKIAEEYGTNQREIIAQVYKNFDYCFELCQNPFDRGKKLLKGIWQFNYDVSRDICEADQICEYDFRDCVWKWNPLPVKKKLEKYPEEEFFIKAFIKELIILAECNPLDSKTVVPGYYRSC